MSLREIAPACSPLQKKTSLEGKYPPVPKRCVVTGGTGFVGLRLVEMLIERGAEHVVAFDVVSIDRLPDEVKSRIWCHPKIKYLQGDITNKEEVARAFQGADCVWHIAAAVGPFHPNEVYYKVNFEGTVNVVQACRECGVKKLVMSSSPSTRMTGDDIDGLSEDELPNFEQMHGKWLQPYAETKFLGEDYCTRNSDEELYTVAIAPHQVYGPRDNLFLPNILENAGIGRLRVFSKASTGYGKNKVCFTHVDNYCHGLILGERAIGPNGKANGKFYIVTDADTHPYKEGYLYLWEELDVMATGLGFQSIRNKTPVPYWLGIFIGYICLYVGYLLNAKFRISPFSVKMLTMHRWFRPDAAKKDLGYEPIVKYREGWKDCENWFRDNWLPRFQENLRTGKNRFAIISDNTKNKIDIQTDSVTKKVQ